MHLHVIAITKNLKPVKLIAGLALMFNWINLRAYKRANIETHGDTSSMYNV